MDIKGNFSEIIRKFEERQKKMRDGLRTATEKATAYAHSQVPPYPPKSPTSRYERTGTLGRSIATAVRELGSSFVGVIGTKVIYAPYVISDAALSDGRGPQTPVHKRNNWWTLQGVVRGAKDEIMKIYKRVIDEVAK